MFDLYLAVTAPPVGLQKLLSLWPLWLPIVVGALAIFLLMPRPRPYPTVYGALLGLLALLLAGRFLVAPVGVAPETVLFYLFAGLAVASGTLLVTQQNPARAALSFTLVVLNGCGLFLLLAAPFLMAATIIVYAGAIIVTFLFVLMLAQQVKWTDADARSEAGRASFTGGILLATLLFVIGEGYATPSVDALIAGVEKCQKELASVIESSDKEELTKTVKDINEELQGSEQSLLRQTLVLVASHRLKDLTQRVERLLIEEPQGPVDNPTERLSKQLSSLHALLLEARNRLGTNPPPVDRVQLSNLSGPPSNLSASEIRRDSKTGRPMMPADNAAFLGRSLFTDYLLPLQLGGLLLLVATVGAVAIAQRHLDQTRKSQAANRGGSGGQA
jgi:NADH-quinone oxidoreductase subunit J